MCSTWCFKGERSKKAISSQSDFLLREILVHNFSWLQNSVMTLTNYFSFLFIDLMSFDLCRPDKICCWFEFPNRQAGKLPFQWNSESQAFLMFLSVHFKDYFFDGNLKEIVLNPIFQLILDYETDIITHFTDVFLNQILQLSLVIICFT